MEGGRQTANEVESPELRMPAFCLLWGSDSRRLVGVACFALPLAIGVFSSLEQRMFLDDAMIYLTYAKNIATGVGWTFNPGANDHAATSALHTMIQAITFWAFYDPASSDAILLVIKAVEAIFVVGGVCLFYRVLTSSGIEPVLAGCTVAAFVSAKFVAVFHLFSGMETPLYLLFLMLAVLAYAKRRFRAVGLVTGILYFVRPEAILVGPILALFDLATERRNAPREWFRQWLPAGSISAALLVCGGSAFYIAKGSMLPDSAEVKLLTAANWGSYASRIPDIIAEYGLWTPFAVLGVFSLEKRATASNALLTCSVCLVILFVAMGLPRAPWYYTPFNVGFFTLVAAGLARVHSELRARALPHWPLYAALAVALVAVEGSGLQQARANRWAMRWHAQQLDGGLGAASRWLAERAAPGQRVAAASIGYVGYYGVNDVVDIVGLLDPEVARQTFAGNTNYWFETQRPAHVIRRLEFREGIEKLPYRLVAVFGDPNHPEKATGVFSLHEELATR